MIVCESESNFSFVITKEMQRKLAQILYYRNDLADRIQPFFKNLNNENINDEKYTPLLQTFSKDILSVLQANEIHISSWISRNEKPFNTFNSVYLLNDRSHLTEEFFDSDFGNFEKSFPGNQTFFDISNLNNLFLFQNFGKIS